MKRNSATRRLGALLSAVIVIAGGLTILVSLPASAASQVFGVPGTAGPAGLAGSTGFVKTGIILSGNSVTVTCSGTAQYAPGSSSTCAGFNGPNNYVAGNPAVDLIARVGGGGWIHVGAGPRVVSGSGELEFGYNDCEASTAFPNGCFYDNGGAFTVTVDDLPDPSPSPTETQPPTASFTATKGSGADHLKVTFAATADDPDAEGSPPEITMYEWNFDDGNGFQTLGPNPVKTYIDIGTYDVQLRVTDNDGESTTVHMMVELANATIKGSVFDGSVGDGHRNPLPGAFIELRKNNDVVQGPIPTTESGGFEFNEVKPGDYNIRVILADAVLNDPPAFEVRYGDAASEAAWAEVNVSVKTEDEGKVVEKDIDMSAEVDQATTFSKLHTLARLFRSLHRFAAWSQEELPTGLSSGNAPAPVEFYTYSDEANKEKGAFYRGSETAIYLSSAQSATAGSGANHTEWHEFTHHLAHVAGIADTCDGENHAGWRNESTCDSVSEGLATWLPAIAAKDLGGTEGIMQNDGWTIDMESNGWKAWTKEGDLQREDIASGALLWDLTDATNESTDLPVYDLTGDTTVLIPVSDVITLPIPTVWDALTTAGHSATVVSLRDALYEDVSVSSQLKALSVKLGLDNTLNATALDVPFLIHGFYPVHIVQPFPVAEFAAGYFLGSADERGIPGTAPNRAVGRTDRPIIGGTLGAFPDRFTSPEVPNSNVLLLDDHGDPISDAEVEFTFSYPERTYTTHEHVGSGGLLHVELPPYYDEIPFDGNSLPACDNATDYRVKVTLRVMINGAWSEPVDFDNCELIQGLETTTTDYALSLRMTVPSYGGGGGIYPTPTPAPSPSEPTPTVTPSPEPTATVPVDVATCAVAPEATNRRKIRLVGAGWSPGSIVRLTFDRRARRQVPTDSTGGFSVNRWVPKHTAPGTHAFHCRGTDSNGLAADIAAQVSVVRLKLFWTNGLTSVLSRPVL